MSNPKKRKKSFRELLEKYLDVKGLDIIVVLTDGSEIELSKNRTLTADSIISMDQFHCENIIPLSRIASVEMYAA